MKATTDIPSNNPTQVGRDRWARRGTGEAPISLVAGPTVPPYLLCLAFSAAVFWLSGCSDSHAHAQVPESPAASTYKAGHGVQLSPAAAEFAGVATAEFTGRLPADALLRTVKGDFVYVANGGWLLRTPVEVAADNVTVTSGLYDGDVIATQGVRALWLAELQAINGGVGCADGH